MRDVKKKTKERVRWSLRQAMIQEGLPPRKEPGPSHPPKLKTPEAVRADKRKVNAKLRGNNVDKAKRLRILARICAWYAEDLELYAKHGKKHQKSISKLEHGFLDQWEKTLGDFKQKSTIDEETLRELSLIHI